MTEGRALSWRYVATLVICATIIAVLVARPQSPAEADHSDGNMPDEVNYWLVKS